MKKIKTKGFTLIELIIVVGLLGLLSVGIGITLNKVFKDQEEDEIATFYENVKASANMYIQNNPGIINELYDNKGFEIISINDISNQGYINDETTDPRTKDSIKPDEKVKISLNSSGEITIEYPYNGNDEDYLQALDLNIMINSNKNEICYAELDTYELGYIDVNGSLVSKYFENDRSRITAYLDNNGILSDCNNNAFNISKAGTYKIVYKYITSDGKEKQTSRNVNVIANKPKVDIEIASKRSGYNYHIVDIKLTNIYDVLYNNVEICISDVDSYADCKNSNLSNKDLDFNVWKRYNVGENITYSNIDLTTYGEKYSNKCNQPETFSKYVFIRNDGDAYNKANQDKIEYSIRKVCEAPKIEEFTIKSTNEKYNSSTVELKYRINFVEPQVSICVGTSKEASSCTNWQVVDSNKVISTQVNLTTYNSRWDNSKNDNRDVKLYLFAKSAEGSNDEISSKKATYSLYKTCDSTTTVPGDWSTDCPCGGYKTRTVSYNDEFFGNTCSTIPENGESCPSCNKCPEGMHEGGGGYPCCCYPTSGGKYIGYGGGRYHCLNVHTGNNC